MGDLTLEALKGSIAKWEAIVAGTGTDQGPDNCPLCHLFWESGCDLCPVWRSTGMSACRSTPYQEYDDASYNYGVASPQAKAAAQAELDFLRSLLPEEHRERREESQDIQADPSPKGEATPMTNVISMATRLPIANVIPIHINEPRIPGDRDTAGRFGCAALRAGRNQRPGNSPTNNEFAPPHNKERA